MGAPRDLGIEGYRGFVRIGSGGYSSVYRARQELFDRDVAVKILSVQVVDDATRRRFRRECSAAGRISDHPHVATLLDAGFTATGSPYLTTEYCPGGSLADALRERGPLPVDQVLRMGQKLATGLQAVHEAGVLHRDIKPANILVSAYGEPMLSDFGIALAEPGVAATGVNVATPYYTAPEVVVGGDPSIAADVYSLAATLYELLSGRPPHASDNLPLAELLARIQHEPVAPLRRADLPPEARDLLARALSPDPGERPRTARSFGEALGALVEPVPSPSQEHPVVAPPVGRGDGAAPAAAAEAPSPTGEWIAPPPVGDGASPTAPPPDAPAPPARGGRLRWLAVGAAALVLGVLAAVGVVTLVTGDDPPSETAGPAGEEPEAGEESEAGPAPTTAVVPPDRVASLLELLGDFELGGDEIHAELQAVTDDSGLLTLQIPVTWDEVDTSTHVIGDLPTPGISASEDLASFAAFDGAAGTVVLSLPGVEPSPEGLAFLLDLLELPPDCAPTGVVDFNDGATSGTAQAFQGCGGTDGIYVALLAGRDDGAGSVFVGAMIDSNADAALLDQLFGLVESSIDG